MAVSVVREATQETLRMRSTDWKVLVAIAKALEPDVELPYPARAAIDGASFELNEHEGEALGDAFEAVMRISEAVRHGSVEADGTLNLATA